MLHAKMEDPEPDEQTKLENIKWRGGDKYNKTEVSGKKKKSLS